MHEMSIVEALLESVRAEVKAHADTRVLRVDVRIGALRLVIPETLQFCYHAATRDTELADSKLNVTTVAAIARCRQCQSRFPVEENWFACTQCGALGGVLETGNELDLTGIELEQTDPYVPA